MRISRPWRRRHSPQPPYGTVPYHRAMARSHARMTYANIGLIVALTVLITLPATAWWTRPFDLAIALFAFRNYRVSRALTLEHRVKAWQVELNETLTGMSMSGIFTQEEALEALASSPPPGVKRQDWESIGDEIRRAHPDLFGDDQ